MGPASLVSTSVGQGVAWVSMSSTSWLEDVRALTLLASPLQASSILGELNAVLEDVRAWPDWPLLVAFSFASKCDSMTWQLSVSGLAEPERA